MNNPPCTKKTDRSFQSYKIRFVELSRAIAGAFSGGINYELARVTDLSETSIIIIGNTIANFSAWILGEKIIHPLCVFFNWYTESNSKNPLYRNFKTLASLGSSIGIIFAIIGASANKLKLNISVYSAYASFILGVSTFAYRRYQQSIQAKSGGEEIIHAQVGTEGWSKYTKIALILGALIGQSIGGYISYVNGYDAITSWYNITLYGSIASVVGFFSIALVVPVVNYLTQNEKKMGILVSKNQDIFKTNYMRSGMTLGVSIGSILGGVVGPAVIVGLSPAIGIVIGAAVFAFISGIGLGVCGCYITSHLQEYWHVLKTTDNDWSYATRNTSYVFGFIGTAIACVLCPGAALLQAVALGSAISSFIGWFAGFGVIWVARYVEPDEQMIKPPELPWTQRISVGANRGSIIGSFSGLALGLCVGGPLGLIGWIVLCGALGALLGSSTEWLVHPDPIRIIEKILFRDRRLAAINVVAPEKAACNLESSHEIRRKLIEINPDCTVHYTVDKLQIVLCDEALEYVSRQKNLVRIQASSAMFFSHTNYLSERRHNNMYMQKKYDEEFGLVLR